jgi:L-glyceraldehyde 3-phosphate reductase
VTHFDLANNYGPPYGSAEENFGSRMGHVARAVRPGRLAQVRPGVAR